MRGEANYFRIGMFIILAAALLAAGLITFGLGQFFKHKIYLETYVDGTVQGIEVGSPVKFRGVTVGKVASVGFLYLEYPRLERTTTPNYVVLLMEIDTEIFPDMFSADDLGQILGQAVQKGLRVQIEPQGITGMNYLEINYLEPWRFESIKLSWKPRYFYLPSAPGELTSILDSVNNIMREIEDLNIKGISEGLVNLVDNLDKAITGAQLHELSQSAQEVFKSVSTAIDQLNVKDLSLEARNLLTEIRSSNDQLQTILGNLEPASQLNADDVAATLANLRAVSDNLRTVSNRIARNPSELIFSRPPKPASVMEAPARKSR